jgi:hypothetical protein
MSIPKAKVKTLTLVGFKLKLILNLENDIATVAYISDTEVFHEILEDVLQNNQIGPHYLHPVCIDWLVQNFEDVYDKLKK